MGFSTSAGFKPHGWPAAELTMTRMAVLMAFRSFAQAVTTRVRKELDFGSVSAHGFEIVGGRLDYIAGHPAATLVYQCRKHYISLLIWPSEAGKTTAKTLVLESKAAQRGYQIIHWTANGMNHWAVSEIASDELHDFGNAFATDETIR
jgi:anti-sigma factor RsiW